MKHVLKTENFMLTINPQIFEQDMACSSNTIMEVMVSCDGFSGETSMDIDAKELGRFARDLCHLYEKLDGEAKIQEPYGVQMFLAFSGNGRGEITVAGYIEKSLCHGGAQSLRFESRFDQTFLREFSRGLYDAYGKYAQM